MLDDAIFREIVRAIASHVTRCICKRYMYIATFWRNQLLCQYKNFCLHLKLFLIVGNSKIVLIKKYVYRPKLFLYHLAIFNWLRTRCTPLALSWVIHFSKEYQPIQLLKTEGLIILAHYCFLEFAFSLTVYTVVG